jgi:calcium-dependent protein kinase
VGKFDFPSPEWDEISQAAKDFVVQLLKKSPTTRPTAADALKHRWLKEQLGVKNEIISQASISHCSVRTGEFTKYLAMKKLKKAALGYIASNLTQAEVGTLEEIFRSLDQNRTGHITLTELDEAIEKGKFNAQVLQDLRQLRQDLSLADEEQMNYRDFLAATMDRSLAMREDNMKKAFDHFKHSSDGANHLTLQDLSDIFGGEGHAQEIMTLLDHDGDGKVSYEDFRHAVAESMEDDEDDDSGFYS